ncbi:hypothetical protein IE81DRAFT_63428 [Ceraceosorus guamensis]|uniref:Uncharacterized protein n=1 Tax=Ceraceosorus guamensis TaxID=1522189 RepID=A0A316VTW7_9BASI|nr:hypothetical protein IE81DRAFT_63428 [Ceraceosorus guamensis]PWN38945.1 hypothetical protein IE81DRAFT_63428 [Ceraceosorus guamensis]
MHAAATTTLQAVTASTTITTTTTETTSTTVTADTAQTAVAPPPPQGQDATFLRIEGSTETIFEGFVNSKAKTFNFPAGPLVCDSRVGAGGSVITAIADLGLPVRVTPTYNAEGVILGRVKNDEAGQGPYEWVSGAKAVWMPWLTRAC